MSVGEVRCFVMVETSVCSFIMRPAATLNRLRGRELWFPLGFVFNSDQLLSGHM